MILISLMFPMAMNNTGKSDTLPKHLRRMITLSIADGDVTSVDGIVSFILLDGPEID